MPDRRCASSNTASSLVTFLGFVGLLHALGMSQDPHPGGHRLGDLVGVERRALAQVVAADEQLERVREVERLPDPADVGGVLADDVRRGRELARRRVVAQHDGRLLGEHLARGLAPTPRGRTSRAPPASAW